MATKEQKREREKQLRRRLAELSAPAYIKSLNVPFDLAIVGGGPSGLAAAIVAQELGLSCCVFERELSCGQTILKTGAGRCNIANAHISYDKYFHPEFVQAAIEKNFGDTQAWADAIRKLFDSCGLPLAEEDEGRLYPLSRSAASVQTALAERGRALGVVLACGQEVLSIKRTGGQFSFELHSLVDELIAKRPRLNIHKPKLPAIHAKQVIIASSMQAELACCGDAKLQADIVRPWEPCNKQISVEDSRLAAADGVQIHARLRAYHHGELVHDELGQLLIRKGWLSGIVSLNTSRDIEPGDTIAIDFLPDLDELTAATYLERGSLQTLLPPKLAQVFEHAGDPLALIKNYTLTVRNGTPLPNSWQATRGGIRISAINPQTLELQDIPKIYVIGDAVDVDAACGGYNLSWAWASAIIAAQSAHERR